MNDCALKLLIFVHYSVGTVKVLLMMNVTVVGEFQGKLVSVSQENILPEYWVENLIRPVLLMMLFKRAERKGEFPLHFHAYKNAPIFLVFVFPSIDKIFILGGRLGTRP